MHRATCLALRTASAAPAAGWQRIFRKGTPTAERWRTRCSVLALLMRSSIAPQSAVLWRGDRTAANPLEAHTQSSALNYSVSALKPINQAIPSRPCCGERRSAGLPKMGRLAHLDHGWHLVVSFPTVQSGSGRPGDAGTFPSGDGWARATGCGGYPQPVCAEGQLVKRPASERAGSGVLWRRCW
jgi:hypothetical protein